MASKIKVLIVDDHPIARDGIRANIASKAKDIVVTGEAGSIAEANKLLSSNDFDIAIIDVALDGENGLDLVEMLDEGSPRAIVMTCYEPELYVKTAMTLGAKGYVDKSSLGDDLIDAIRDVNDGKVYLSPDASQTFFQQQSRYGVLDLAPREREVFDLIGQGKTTQEISEIMEVSAKTVQGWRHQIKIKLGTRSAAELVHLATRMTAFAQPVK